jgi:hypothetical protein
MANIRILFTFLCILSLISCGRKSSDFNEIIIDSEKCKKWNLPELNVKVEIPKEYKLTFDENDGFYFQAHKYDENNRLLSEVSFGRIEGEFKKENILKSLEDGERAIMQHMDSIKQISYKTTFLGNRIIGESELTQLRGVVEFKNFNVVFDGKFYSFMAPLLLDDVNRIMISSITRDSENIDVESEIGTDLLNIIKSVKKTN